MSGHSTLKTMVIVGRDVAAWLSANALIHAFGRSGLQVVVIELPSLLREHDAISTLPALEAMHRLLGLDEHEVVRQSAGTFTLGQSFVNFSRTRPPFFHPYGAHGTGINRLPFLQYWIKAQMGGLKVGLEDFSINAAAAKAGRFFVPTREISAFSKCDYGYHLRAQPYVAHLKSRAIRQGVTVFAARNFDVRFNGETGHIQALRLNDGREIAGDIFIDATGAESLLLGKVLKTPAESWSAWFPDNRILTTSAAPMKVLPPYSQVRALRDSVLHIAPLQDMTSVQHVYHSEDLKDDKAFEIAVELTGKPLRDSAVVDEFSVGRRTRAWEKNCIAIGEAACVLNPIDNPGLHSVHLGLAHLISLFPLTQDMQLEANEYNQKIQQSFERIRDFQICHFKLNRNLDQPMWDHFRAMEIPDTLAYKLDLFAARGIVALYEDETFEADDWMAILTGHGLLPRSYDPLVDLTPEEKVIEQFQQMLGFIAKQVQAMDSHDVYLEINAAMDYH